MGYIHLGCLLEQDIEQAERVVLIPGLHPIHYLIEWKVTLNNRTVAKDFEQVPVLASRFHWRLFLQPKLKELLVRKYPHRKLELNDTTVVVFATRQKGL